MEQIVTEQKVINQAADILRMGGLVAFPTETYYGLAVDPYNESALQRLFSIKNRSSVKPVLVLIPSRDYLYQMTDSIPSSAEKLMKKFWPGPLTMVFDARKELSGLLTGGTGTIGVRLSPNPVAKTLLNAFGGPLTATSANRSGEKAAETENEVLQIFGDKVDMILPGGRTPGQKPSTLIRISDHIIECIREGSIPCAEIQAFIESDC